MGKLQLPSGLKVCGQARMTAFRPHNRARDDDAGGQICTGVPALALSDRGGPLQLRILLSSAIHA